MIEDKKKMSVNKWQYDAFISYSHNERDKKIAKKLHKFLELYKLPGNVKDIAAKDGDTPKRRINRVFRDEEELKLTSDLDASITEALDNSEFLICICSNEYVNSQWCMRELEYFLKERGRDNIFVVITDGDEKNVIPKQLCHKRVPIKDEDGFYRDQDVEIEPLAADVRGKGDKEREKRLKNESLRIVAPMFGCGYDTLKQRARVQSLKRRLYISMISLFVCVAVFATGFVMFLEISEKNKQIEMQNKQIEQQYASILETNVDIESKEAVRLYEDGNYIEAFEKAANAYSYCDSTGEVPYNKEARYALTGAMGLYSDGNYAINTALIDLDSDVMNMCVSNDGKYCSIFEYSGECNIYDMSTTELVDSFEYDNGATFYNVNPMYTAENNMIYGDFDGIYLYDTEEGERIALEHETNSFNEKGGMKYLYFEECSKIVVYYWDTVCIYDSVSGEYIASVKKEKDGYVQMYVQCELNDDEDSFTVIYENSNSEERYKVIVYDINSLTPINEFVLKGSPSCPCYAYGTFAYYDIEDGEGDWDFSNYLVFYDVSTGEENVFEDVELDSHIVIGADGMAWTYEDLEANIIRYRFREGECYKTSFASNPDSDILYARFVDLESDVFYVITDECVNMYYYVELDGAMYESIAERCPEGVEKIEVFSGGYLMYVPKNKRIYIMEYPTVMEYSKSGDAVKAYNDYDKEDHRVSDEIMYDYSDAVGEPYHLITDIVYANDGKHCAIAHRDGRIEIARIKNGKVDTTHMSLLNNFYSDISLKSVFINDDYLLINCGSKDGYLYDISDIDIDKEYVTEDMQIATIGDFVYADLDEGYILTESVGHYYWFPLYSAEDVGNEALARMKKQG